MAEGSVDRAIKLHIPNERLWSSRVHGNIFLHRGPIRLMDYEWEEWRRDDGNHGAAAGAAGAAAGAAGAAATAALVVLFAVFGRN